MTQLPAHKCPRCEYPNEYRYHQDDGPAKHRWYVCAACHHSYRTLANDGGSPMKPRGKPGFPYTRFECLVAESPRNSLFASGNADPALPKRRTLPPFTCPSCGNYGLVKATLPGYDGGQWRRHKCRGCWETFYSCTSGEPGSEHVEISRHGPGNIVRGQRMPENERARPAPTKALDDAALVEVMRETRTPPSPDDPNYTLGSTLRRMFDEARAPSELPTEVDGEVDDMVACPSCGAIEGTPEWGTVGDGYDGYCPACADSRLRYG